MIMSSHAPCTPCARPSHWLWILLVSPALAGCVDDGFAPDCPSSEDYTDEDGTFDFDAWRAAAQTQGCVTPIGGPGGQSGGTP